MDKVKLKRYRIREYSLLWWTKYTLIILGIIAALGLLNGWILSLE